VNEVNGHWARLVLGRDDRLRAGIPSRYVTSQPGQLSLASVRGRLIEWPKLTSFGWGEGGTSPLSVAGNTVWHISSCSGVAG